MIARRTALLATAALLGLGGGASGQITGSLDVGAGTYRPDRAIPGGVASIAPTLLLDYGDLRLGATGVYSDAPAGRWNFQTTGFGRLRSPRLGPFAAEASGQVDVTSHFRVRGATALTADLRVYAYPFRGTSLWVGRGLGSATTLDRRRPLQRSEVGTSASVGGVEVGLSLSSTTFELMGGPLRSEADSARSLVPSGPLTSHSASPERRTSLTDAILSSRWRFASIDFDLAVGQRFSRTAPELTIWGVSAAKGLMPNVALVGGAGRSGFDPVTSVPGSRYFVLGLRLKLGPAPGRLLAVLPVPVEDAPLRIGPALPAGREILVRVPGATLVELAGDFTDWQPVTLQPVEDGGWRAVLHIAPGLHRLAIRIDQGQWRPPPGTRPVRSEFGGDVAEVVVE